MSKGRRTSQSTRFEVPFQPQRKYQNRKTRGGAGDTNRAIVNAGIIVAATIITTVILLAISGQIYDSTNVAMVAQPAAPLSATVIASPSASVNSTVATPSPTPRRTAPTPSPAMEVETSAPDDTAIQAAIDKKLAADNNLAELGITATVSDAKVILVGTAPSDELKARVEKLVRTVQGVKRVENQIAVVIN